MKIHPIPLIVSVVLSGAILFGGFFVYHSVALESPLHDAVSDIDGVQEARTNIDDNQVNITLTLAHDANLREVVTQINDSNADLLKNRDLHIVISEEHPSEALDAWWTRSLFDIAEAMEQKQYSKIPEILEARAGSLEGLSYATEIDKDYVYIRLNYGDSSKFVLLPRTPPVMGVWS